MLDLQEKEFFENNDILLKQILFLDTSSFVNNGGIQIINILKSEKNGFCIIVSINEYQINLYFGQINENNYLRKILSKLESNDFEISDNFEMSDKNSLRRNRVILHLNNILSKNLTF